MLTVERLREVLDYDRVTGVFRWKIALSPRLPVGAVAGSIRKKDGYRIIRIDGKPYIAHRLAWFFVYGVWPSERLDHKDTSRDFNAIENLRPATRTQNLANSRRSKANRSSYKGVSLDRGKWRAVIRANNRYILLGRFSSKEDARAAYAEAAARYFGEYARAA